MCSSIPNPQLRKSSVGLVSEFPKLMKSATSYSCIMIAICLLWVTVNGDPGVSHLLVDKGLPRWGVLGDDADLIQLFKTTKNVVIIRIQSVSYEKVADTGLFREKITAAVVGVIKGDFSKNENIAICYVPEGIPQNDEEREKKRVALEKLLKSCERVVFIENKKSNNIYEMDRSMHAFCTRELLEFLDSLSRKHEVEAGNSSEK